VGEVILKKYMPVTKVPGPMIHASYLSFQSLIFPIKFRGNEIEAVDNG
jgi:hypothetical protein